MGNKMSTSTSSNPTTQQSNTPKSGDSCTHPTFVVESRCPDCGQSFGRQEVDRHEMTAEEIAAQQVGNLPDREAMSLVNANLAIPINLAAALNVLSDGSIAGANAQQVAPIGQDMLGGTPTLPT